jgi:hypothetical protein
MRDFMRDYARGGRFMRDFMRTVMLDYARGGRFMREFMRERVLCASFCGARFNWRRLISIDREC